MKKMLILAATVGCFLLSACDNDPTPDGTVVVESDLGEGCRLMKVHERGTESYYIYVTRCPTSKTTTLEDTSHYVGNRRVQSDQSMEVTAP